MTAKNLMSSKVSKRLRVDHLIEVSKANAKTISNFRLGYYLCSSSGLEINDLVQNACVDRFTLAVETFKTAKWASKAQRPTNRIVVARSYYAMYHAARAVVYHVKSGDDHEAHSELPKFLPRDFPNKNFWENELKDARLERNRADDDPYPKTDKAFAATACRKLQKADEFIILARSYLVGKGCAL